MPINYDLFVIIPFIGLLISMAILPQLIPHLWEKHMGKITSIWIICSLLITFFQNSSFTPYTHAIIEDYIPFISLIFALYSISSGMHLTLKFRNSAVNNTLYLLCSGIIAGFIGTTGASLLLIRPFFNLNQHRTFKTHLGIFYIIIVSNIGGALSPLGDPPLFLGYLKGIDFFWPTLYLSSATFTLLSILLVIFFTLDTYFFSKEKNITIHTAEKFSFDGKFNLILLGGSIITSFTPIPFWTRSLILILLGMLSFYITPMQKRKKWGFNMEPFFEIFKLFIGIFITIAPIVGLLKLGAHGPLKPLFELFNISASMSPSQFFWTTGLLSSVLDNAPTYLVFFHIAGGNPTDLMTTHLPTLTAISLGSVFMGALTYIGNAPNLMVRSIAQHKGAKMPHFFGYMFWSFILLIPLFWIIDCVFVK